MKTGFVSLVGAGCGRADLITLRGMERLKGCDAVVYDDLIDPALLSFPPADAVHLYMGKRQGRHSAPQEEISATLIRLAQEGKRVVRLKGGDPFVFGRGGEELLALSEAGIPCEEIPGISSAIAIPAAAGIPVTHRGLSRSLHIITSHTASSPLPQNLPQLAQLGGTLVFLMGLSRLSAIAQGLQDAGMSPDTPAAVISGGNAPCPACVRGPLKEIAALAQDVQPPAVIVVGETAALDVYSALPLRGVTVGVTGTSAVTGKLIPALEGLGATAIPLQTSVPEPLPFPLSPGDFPARKPRWLVFTSANGVDCFLRGLDALGVDMRTLAGDRIAVIGSATAQALRRRGLYPELCPSHATSRSLALALCQAGAPGEEMVLLRSEQGAAILPQLLHEHGFPVRDLPLYRLAEASALPQLPHPLHYLTFASSSAVDAFFARYGALPPEVTPVCIGEVTAAALARHTSQSFLTAPDISARSMVEVILAHKTGGQ